MSVLTKKKNALYQMVTGNYTILLIFLLLIFLFRPDEAGEIIYTYVWRVFFTITLLLAIFNCKHNSVTKVLVSWLSIPVIILSWFDLVYTSQAMILMGFLFTILFMAICTGSILYDVVLRARVTMETLRGVVCAYFLVAFIFSYIFFLVEIHDPGSIIIRSEVLPAFPVNQYMSQMTYFSFTTLLTMGYGDIVAAKKWAQSVAVIEGIIGQFYIAILVSRLVSVYSFYANQKLVKTVESDMKGK